MPLFLRISATEWLEHTGEPSWTVDDTIRLAKELPGLGVDLLDVSTAGNHPGQRVPFEDPFYQVDIAGRIRREVRGAGVGLLVGGVGQVNDAVRARDIVQDGPLPGAEGGQGGEPRADLLFVARQFLKEPSWVMHVAEELGVEVKRPVQYGYAVGGMEKMKRKQREGGKL